MSEEISTMELAKQVEAKKNADLFTKQEEPQVQTPQVTDLVHGAFNQAVVHQMKNNDELRDKILNTAENCVKTEINTLQTETKTKNTAAKFDSAKDACECYCFGGKEKTTPTWAVNIMKCGYSAALFLWLIFATFTIMPIVFITKKIQVGIKATWLAILLAIVIYLGLTVVPPLVALLSSL